MNDLGQRAPFCQKAAKTNAVEGAFFSWHHNRRVATCAAGQGGGQVFLERHLLPSGANRPVDQTKTARANLLDNAVTTHRFSRRQGCGR